MVPLMLAIEVSFFLLNSIHLSALSVVILHSPAVLHPTDHPWYWLGLIAYNIFVLAILSTCIEKVIQLIFNHREKTFTCPGLSAKLGKLNSVYLALLSAVTSITLYVTIISTSIVMKPKPS
jgi:hypothetical protein